MRSGTAALVSKAFHGSVSDIEVLRSHTDEINAVLAGRSMLADLGYRGVQHDVPTIVVCVTCSTFKTELCVFWWNAISDV